jgi:hypothetical protein
MFTDIMSQMERMRLFNLKQNIMFLTWHPSVSGLRLKVLIKVW